MRWKALFFLKEEDKYKPVAEEVEFYEKEETYGFKTEKKPHKLYLRLIKTDTWESAF